jgi:hypothetical protein
VERLCEVIRLQGLERLYGLKHALERRGVAAEVWHDGSGGLRRSTAGPTYLRLMVWERDVVYARWVLSSAGLDPWSPR